MTAKKIPEFLEHELVDRDLMEFTEYQSRRIRKELTERGFLKAQHCYYHPTHWRKEDAPQPEPGHHIYGWDDPDHDKLVEACEVYEILDERYFPLTDAAKAWIVKENQELDAMGW